MSKIAIIYTTFLRDSLMFKTIKSITDNLPDNSILLIGDQNPIPKKYCSPFNPQVIAYQFPFDCGLSYTRNFLVQKAKELGCDYCLVTADSISFKQKYNFKPIIDFMSKENVGLVGFELKNRIYWNCDIIVEKDKWILDVPQRNPIKFKDINYQPCDIVRNFFLAKTKTLLDIKWDNKLKLFEHMDFFYRYSQKHKVYFTDYIKADYISKDNEFYHKYRHCRKSEFTRIFHNKYNIKSSHYYTKKLKEKFNEWKSIKR